MKKDIREHKKELHCHIKGAMEDMPTKEQIITSLERKVRFLLEKAKENGAAMTEVRFACTH
jgi:hypothetical protein